MEFLWKSYGSPMEHHASNAGATSQQRAINWLASEGSLPTLRLSRGEFQLPFAGLRRYYAR
jgi:hypothetical protein